MFNAVIAVVLAAVVAPAQGFTSGNETLLRAAIFSGYDSEVRPDAVTSVVMQFIPTSLTAIDIKAGTMQITGWWRLSWNDSRLVWTPSTYDSIGETHSYQNEVWTPPIIIYNSVDNLSAIDENTIPLRISSSGTILWTPPAILTVTCSTDITYFPFDTQTCGVSVTTFGYTINELTVTPNGVDTAFYSANEEWILENTYTESNPGQYSFVSFQFVFERKPAYYGLNLILPVLMCWALSVFIFHLPAESGEKMGYSLTVLLAFVVLMTLLADTMPTTADHVSFLEVYIVMVLAFCGASVGYSIISLAIYYRHDSNPIPACLRSLTVWSKKKSIRPSPEQKAADLPDLQDNALPRKDDWDSTMTRQNSKSDDVKVTWKDVARALDCLVFKIYVGVTSLLTVIFLSVTAAN